MLCCFSVILRMHVKYFNRLYIMLFSEFNILSILVIHLLFNYIYDISLSVGKIENMLLRKLLLPLILMLEGSSVLAADIKKWTDQNGKVHYGDIVGYSQKVEVLDIDNSIPEITEGEALMRLKNDLYFQAQYLKRKEQRLAKKNAIATKRKKQEKSANKREKKLNSDRRACIKARLKIEDIEDDLRQGYTTKKGIQLEKKRRQQKRRVNAYCH